LSQKAAAGYDDSIDAKPFTTKTYKQIPAELQFGLRRKCLMNRFEAIRKMNNN
jgi:hypothetical protein